MAAHSGYALGLTLRPHSWTRVWGVHTHHSGLWAMPPVAMTRPFTFKPHPPPGTHGTPVFPNINFSVSAESASAGFKRNNDPHAVFVVTGASRGLGLQFVKSLVVRTQGRIVACCRRPSRAAQLHDFLSSVGETGRVMVVDLDLENQHSIEAAGKEVMEAHSRVDALFNVAGILGDGHTTPGPEKQLSKIERGWLEKSLAVHVVGPVMLSKALLPALVQRRGRDEGRPASVVANLSARVASISDNRLGGWYSYRLSKAALNQATRTMALELARHSVWCVALHPGTSDTDLSKPFQANVKAGSLFPVHFAAGQLLDVVDSLTKDNSGGFYDWSGQSLSF